LAPSVLPPVTTRIHKNDQPTAGKLLRAATNRRTNPISSGTFEEQLSRSDFPLGELTKEEVRALARRANLLSPKSPKAWELCFVPTGSYVQFIQAYSQERGISLQNGDGEIVMKTAT